MKKRFTLMMMVLCFLMSIPLKMMAYDKVEVVSHYKQGTDWKENPNFNFTTENGKIYTCTLNDVPAGTQAIWFRIKIGTTEYGPQENAIEDLTLTSSYQQIYPISWKEPKALKIVPTSGKTSYTITYDSENNQIKYDAESGGSTGPTPPTPSDENPIDNRKYSKGYYLVGNFFNFDGETINYQDAVFKFQQQKDDAEGNDVYMVQIPATLTAKAQVMSVDATGTAVAVYGPGTNSKTIDNTNPVMGKDHTATLVFNNLEKGVDISENEGNYWNMKSRRTQTTEGGQDGSYTIYLTIDKLKKEPSSLTIKYDDMKRVAYYLSTDEEATAMTLTSNRINYNVNTDQGNFWSGKYQGTLYAQGGSYEFYAISNAMRQIENEDNIFAEYRGQVVNTGNILSTYPKLFLWGNGGKPLNETGNYINAKNGTFKLGDGVVGISSWEFNSNNGHNDMNSLWGNTGGQVQQKDKNKTFTSLSMVGTAIPGTTTAAGEWNWGSDAADMEFDVSENCYKATIVTTGDNTNKPFRFVANRKQEINWFENSNVDQTEMAAKYNNNNGTYGIGHKASPSDPNEISYTESGLTENSGEDYHINWNRPAGTWAVRFYIYTYIDNFGNPAYRYFYTIHKNRDLELRDFGDVVYKSETNVRNIPNKGDYRYFRTWSDNTAWKRPKNVDVFIVSKTPADKTSNGDFELTNINSFNPSEEVIPANTGVILALKKDLEVPGAVFHKRKSLITYNTLVIPLEEATNKDLVYTGGNNHLLPLIEAQVVPTYNKDKGEYNYLFGFYRANKVSDNPDYKDNDFLLGFWISNGKGAFYNNSAYLPIDEATANKMNLGVSYNDFDPTTQAKKVPGVIFDFANVGSGTTGINEVVNQSTKLNDGKYYTLSGQQVEKPTAGGIYIHNGRKFVVK